MSSCKHLKELLEAERPALKKEIDRDKWFESEKVGHDIGLQRAEEHYIDTHLEGWASGFRACYCLRVCQEVNCDYRIE